MREWLLIVALLVGLVLGAARPARAEGTDLTRPREITVTASGQVAAKPDQATVQAGVSANARSAKAALAANSAAMQSVLDGLKAAGIESRDLQTTNFSLQPVFENSQDGKPPKFSGYQVNNAVTVRVRDLSRLGEVLDLVIGKGSNDVGSVSLIVSKADELKDEARKAAVENATRIARAYASAAGVGLGDLLLISDSTFAIEPRPTIFADRPLLRKSAAAPAPIEAGEQLLEAQVTMVWAIK